MLGEIIGTGGIIGALLSVPYAKLLMGTSVGALAFLPGFLISSVAGAIIGLLILSRVKNTSIMRQPASQRS
ncbi:transporter [Gracilibacillus boraciitolerans JCM 21714]|uniref:Transporter n=1 Tax=Gracilibacillus boraciitolerans JCM 21714 TaxID=1298598 RepID=W4VHG5_9BACI|nr:transporter [Gracilibacillus boraciitolerans JCM 21714]